MSESTASYRRILQTSTLTSAASLVNILSGLLRIKALALVLGPTGVGIVGLYTALMTTAGAVAGMGINTVATRQIAEANASNSDVRYVVVWRALLVLGTLLGVVGAVTLWVFREPIADALIGNPYHATAVGWLAIGVALSVASAPQTSLIQGTRRITDMARITIYGAMLNTVLALCALWYCGGSALWLFVLFGPLLTFALGHFYAWKVPKPARPLIRAGEISEQWQKLVKLGMPFMAAGLAGTVVQLWVRVVVNDELSSDGLGHFQASWTISAQYIGFALTAMTADYYPRLTAIQSDTAAATRLVNEQTEVALLIAAPVLLGVMGLAPWIITMLYSQEFLPAAELLRWQAVGDVLKVASWPLGFLILSAGAGGAYFVTESLGLLLMGILVGGLVPHLGLRGAGIAYLAMYVAYLPLVYAYAKRRIGFAWSAHVVVLLAVTLGCCLAIAVAPDGWRARLSLITCVLFTGYTIARLIRLANFNRPLPFGELIRNAITSRLLRVNRAERSQTKGHAPHLRSPTRK